MCGRLSQYRGIHDFVAVLSIPDALINHVGDAALERYRDDCLLAVLAAIGETKRKHGFDFAE